MALKEPPNEGFVVIKFNIGDFPVKEEGPVSKLPPTKDFKAKLTQAEKELSNLIAQSLKPI